MIVNMSKLTLLGVEEQREALIKSLMDLGAVEISAVDADDYEEIGNNPIVNEDLSVIDGKLVMAGAALDSLNKYCPEKKGLFKTRRNITFSEFERINKNLQNVWNVVDEIRQQEEKLIALKSEENRLNNLRLSLIPWRGLSVPLETTGTDKTVFQYGTIPSIISWDLIESEFIEKAPYSKIQKIDSDRDQHYLCFVAHIDAEQQCLSYLKSRGFNRVTFPALSGTVSDNISNLEHRLGIIEREREETIEKIKKMSEHRKSIEVLHDSLMMEKGRLEATAKVLKTKRAFLIKGWIPEKYAFDAKKFLESKYTVSIDIESPGEDEEFPVLLENRGIAEAGEPVLTMYSLPNSREIDPNTVMAPFFILFFGLMLGDGGYGLILAIITGFILWRFKLEDSTRKFMKLMFFCGISTMFWGAMFGGWFGISSLVKYALWLDMVANPELMLSWALLFGVIHMYAGFALKAANLIRQRKYLDALFDVGFWLVFYTGAILYLLPYAPAIDKTRIGHLVQVGQYMLIVGAILLVFTAGRDKKNIFSKIFGGIFSLYDLVSFLSDILSYSRLLALGLATSIIAGIVNEMSVMFDMPVVIKVIMAIAILLVGHIINFAINVLGSYVHSCRLQYLEFFGKFFTGGGEPFRPLKANTKYITLKPDAEV